ncbi:unnamed protein product [Notodromas monacha]|uniref:Uncharacterized protein n=1 Tax=Notodromas monacha TaxID=399045 RepID=A0A7R9GJG8_9CRUS|nr:unnamed protein product [Notodromas monacha]CAG0923544.1 unnamed protein product [Notodromas monacha]
MSENYVHAAEEILKAKQAELLNMLKIEKKRKGVSFVQPLRISAVLEFVRDGHRPRRRVDFTDDVGSDLLLFQPKATRTEDN